MEGLPTAGPAGLVGATGPDHGGNDGGATTGESSSVGPLSKNSGVLVPGTSQIRKPPGFEATGRPQDGQVTPDSSN
ncbi:MAG: hypothetical protein FWF43_00035 [Propionibacteriaceae bacterium]|nr:hypothetical protein [Propionibacteriaceae bacterium]